jgi:hypothetical protein
MKLHEEFKLFENMWETKNLTEALDSDIIVHFECEECGHSFSEKFAHDYFEDEADLEAVIATGDMDCPECGGIAECTGYEYINTGSDVINDSTKTLPDIAYVLKAKDSLGEGFLNIDLSTEQADFSLVASLDKLTEISYSCSKNEAIKYAKEAFNLTIWDWDGTVSVLEVSNFKDAYLGKADPDYTEIYTKSGI